MPEDSSISETVQKKEDPTQIKDFCSFDRSYILCEVACFMDRLVEAGVKRTDIQHSQTSHKEPHAFNEWHYFTVFYPYPTEIK
jgi:hypothetical protein